MFDPSSVPEGCVYRPVPFVLERPFITPRSMFAHTMAARKRSTVQSAWNWATAKPGVNTLPHYALGLDEADGCAKFLPTNRRSIATATVKEHQGGHGNVSTWSMSIETADTGSDADPGISAFTDYQVEMLVRIYVHEFEGWGIPPVKIETWYGAGMATHTDPFGYPYTTLFKGKICPGDKKKAQFWADVLPEVRARLNATPDPAPIPTPPPDPEVDDMPIYAQRDAQGRICVGDGLVQVVYTEDLAEAFVWQIRRAEKAGRPVLTLDGSTMKASEVHELADILSASPTALRSLGRGGTV